MIRDVKLIHCNEREEVIEIESYTENDGAIISQKRRDTDSARPFADVRRELEETGWQVELAGVNHIGHNNPDTNSYVARKAH